MKRELFIEIRVVLQNAHFQRKYKLRQLYAPIGSQQIEMGKVDAQVEATLFFERNPILRKESRTSSFSLV
jgi:hypothetical protein